jgi:hypothetical protein
MKLRAVFACASILACGGGSTGPADDASTTGSKVITATINGAPFVATTISAGYIGGTVSINGTNSTHTLSIAAINLTGPGTYALNVGNPNSALAQVQDPATNQFSTGFGGTGTLTLTIATIQHVKGTFTFTAYTVAGGGLGKPVVTVQNGVVDVTSP